MDFNYDELDNSIVESLSEMSIASNALLNPNNQELLSRTINDVISLYLWSSDLNIINVSNDDDSDSTRPVPKPRIRLSSDEDDERLVKNAWDLNVKHENGIINSGHKKFNNNDIKKETSSIRVIHEEDLENETPKPSPRKTNTKSQSKSHQSDSQFMHKDDGSKLQIPLLDLTPLGGDMKQRKQNLIEQQQPLNKSNLSSKQQQSQPQRSQKQQDVNFEKKERKSDQSQQQIMLKDNKKQNNNNNSNGTRVKDVKTNNNVNNIDKSLSKNIKNDIKLLLKELKLYKNLNIDTNEYYDESMDFKYNKNEYNDKLKTMEIDLKELLIRLIEKRKLAKRTHDVDKMSRDEMMNEKVDTQKELLTFESQNGRPQTKMEKDLMRPLYDHYRKVKRLLNKISNEGHSVLLNEDDFFDDTHLANFQFNTNNKEQQKILRNLHALSMNELVKERDMSIQEKNRLKEIIKKHENDFMQINGRALQKDDREYYKDDFEKYKLLKAKLKLIDALLHKNQSRDAQII